MNGTIEPENLRKGDEVLLVRRRGGVREEASFVVADAAPSPWSTPECPLWLLAADAGERHLVEYTVGGPDAPGHVWKVVPSNPEPSGIDLHPLMHVRRMSPDATLPETAHRLDAGYDLRAFDPTGEHVGWVVPPQGVVAIPTGLEVAIPEWTVLYLCPRSSLALEGVTVANSPATIDAGFRGQLKVLLRNENTDRPFVVNEGDRIAQMELLPVLHPRLVETDHLPASPDGRGESEFGSTGRNRFLKGEDD